MYQKLKELMHKRAQLVEGMRAVGEKCGWVMTADDNAEYTRMSAELEPLNVQINLMQAQLDAERAAGNYQNHQATDDEVRNFMNFIKGEARDMSNTSGNGAAMVPTTLFGSITQQLRQLGVMRSIADVMPATDAQMTIPIDANLPTAYWVDEAAVITASSPTSTYKSVAANKVAVIVKISDELLADSAFNLEPYIVGQVGAAFNLATEDAYINGTLSGQPTGFLGDSTLGLTSSVAAAITTSDILSLYASLGAQYRGNATFLAGDGTLTGLLGLCNPSGQYIFQAGDIVKGVPDILMGRPLKFSPKMPGNGALTGGQKALAFGDFKYYKILDRTNMTAQRLNELYAGNGQVGFKFTMRTDGVLLFGDAIKHLKIKA